MAYKDGNKEEKEGLHICGWAGALNAMLESWTPSRMCLEVGGCKSSDLSSHIQHKQEQEFKTSACMTSTKHKNDR